ncbi:MAG: class II aldolase/adducin family protein [Tissierellia bacterium]|nr:class II aldolase/adducin family protein [Tissierellia bacterium]
MANIDILKEQVLETSIYSYEQGLFAGTSGNLSVYDKESGLVIITPTSIRYDKMKIDDIVVIDISGNIVEGNHKPSSEWQMHCEIYKARDDVLSVFHTHSPYATAFAVNRRSIPLILIEMVPFLGGEVPVAEFALPGTKEMAIEALKVLDNKHACLLSNHGVLTIGNSIDQSHIRAEYVEDAAKIFHYALNGGEVNVLSKEIEVKMKEM